MALGMLDLSIVTDRLIEQLKGCTSASKLWDNATKFDIYYTGLPPDAARKLDGCQVSVYLFHVALDKFHRNTFPTGGTAQTIPEHPLALTLYYLLTAYSLDYIEEQRAMSIALKCLHEHPMVKAKVPIDTTHTREEAFTLTIEPQTADDIGRLWQAMSMPLRLSAVYRASVVFLEPPPPKTPQAVRHEPTIEVVPLGALPPPPVSNVTADKTGFVEITIAKAGFGAGTTTAWLRALPLIETTSATAPLLSRRFRVVDADTLQLRVPLHTPQGQYTLRLRPTADEGTLEIELIVPEPIVTVKAEAGLATIAIDDARFATGAVTVTFDEVTLVETTGTPAAGQFRVVVPSVGHADTLEVRVPIGTLKGRYLLRVLPVAWKVAIRPPVAQPVLEIWVAVP